MTKKEYEKENAILYKALDEIYKMPKPFMEDSDLSDIEPAVTFGKIEKIAHRALFPNRR